MSNSITMRKHTAGAIAVAAAMTVAMGVACAMPAQAHATAREYGQLCSKYETNNNPAYVESGVSYGAYQIDAKEAHQFALYLKHGANKTSASSRKACVTMGKSLLSAYNKDGKKCGTNFNVAWKNCAKAHQTIFFNSQYGFCKANFYDKAITYCKKVCKTFHPSKFSVALRNVIFSTAVEHGAKNTAYVFFKKAMKKCGGINSNTGEDMIISYIYQERSRKTKTAPASYGSVQVSASNLRSAKLVATAKKCGLLNKYLYYFSNYTAAAQLDEYQRLHTEEPAAALKMMVKYGGYCSHHFTTGGKNIYKRSADGGAYHTVYTTTLKCESCGAILADQTSPKTELHTYKYKGTKRKCACGAVATGFKANSWYYSAVDAVNVRSKASTSGAIKTVMRPGKMGKVISRTKGADKCWWGKIKVNGTTGYVRLNLLTMHGNACTTGHVYANGVCKYCHTSKAVINRRSKGTYTAKTKTYYYTAAFTQAKKKATLAKGKKVTIVKVVKNSYNELWGVTKSNHYVEMCKIKK